MRNTHSKSPILCQPYALWQQEVNESAWNTPPMDSEHFMMVQYLTFFIFHAIIFIAINQRRRNETRSKARHGSTECGASTDRIASVPPASCTSKSRSLVRGRWSQGNNMGQWRPHLDDHWIPPHHRVEHAAHKRRFSFLTTCST